jgi:hypothetical protein
MHQVVRLVRAEVAQPRLPCVSTESANDSFETKGAIEAMKRMNLRVYDPSEQGNFFDAPPLFVSILSDGDWATTKVMPFAQKLSAPFVSIGRKYDGGAEAEHQLSKKHLKATTTIIMMGKFKSLSLTKLPTSRINRTK